MTEIDSMSSETLLWDIRGWKRLAGHEDPPLVALREEFLAWLAEVPEPHRVDLSARLRSEDDRAHLSARLELFVHHYLCWNGWEVQVHPQVAHSSNHPDFLAEKGDAKVVVECRSIFDQLAIAQQDQRLRQLADETSTRLGRTVILHPLSDLPQSIPVRRIRTWIQRQHFLGDGTDCLEFDFWDDHQGRHYGVRVILPRLSDGGESVTGVHGIMSQVQAITNAQQLRDALQEKASKYGTLDVPYVIAVSGETRFPMTRKHEVDALFGDRVWNIRRHGPVMVTETRNPNGLFTSHQNDVPEYSEVSAVLVYRFKWLDEGHENRIHIYHNPYAGKPIDPGLFPGVPQLVRQGETTTQWINGKPKMD